MCNLVTLRCTTSVFVALCDQRLTLLISPPNKILLLTWGSSVRTLSCCCFHHFSSCCNSDTIWYDSDTLVLAIGQVALLLQQCLEYTRFSCDDGGNVPPLDLEKSQTGYVEYQPCQYYVSNCNVQPYPLQ